MQISGQATSTGGTGKTTAEMQAISTFRDTDWDFVEETASDRPHIGNYRGPKLRFRLPGISLAAM